MNTKTIRYFINAFCLFAISLLLTGCYGYERYNNYEDSECKDCPTHLVNSPWSDQYLLLKPWLSQIAINKPINLCDRGGLLYVKMHNHSSLSSAYFEDAVMVTLQHNHFFDRIVTREPTVYINVEPYSPEERDDDTLWYDTDDPLTVGQIRKMYPERDKLILEVHLQEFSKNEPIVMTLNLINPDDGSTIIFWRRSRAVWNRTEDMQAVPLIRDFNRWMNDVHHQCRMSEKGKGNDDEMEVEIEIKGAKTTSVLAPSIKPDK